MVFRRHLFVRWFVCLALTVSCFALLAEPSAQALARRARNLEKAGRLDEALLLYNQAAFKDPDHIEWAIKSKELTNQLVAKSVVPLAPAPAAPEPEEPVALDTITEGDLRNAREMQPPPNLLLPDGNFDLDFRNDARRLWEDVAKTLRLTVIFDQDYTPGTQIRFRTSGQDARKALQALSVATSSFVVPLTPTKILVAKDTTQKRQELEPTVAVVLSLPDPLSTQELQEAARAVQQTMELQKFSIDNVRRMVLIRDRLSKVRPAQLLFEQLLGARPSVFVEVELYEMRKASSTDVGVTTPTATRLFQIGRFFHQQPVLPDIAYATIGGGQTLLGLEVTNAAVTATLLKSYGTQKTHAVVQSTSGQAVTLLVGQRYPIMTAGYFGDTSGGGEIYRPPATFQYENLGVQLKITPFIHGTDDITLEIDSEFKLLAGSAVNGIPVLSNRKFTSRVRIRNGEWAIMAGLVGENRSFSMSGIPGLIQAPLIGPLFRSNSIDSEETETLFILKPRLLGLPPGLDAKDPIFLGPEGRPSMPL